MSNEELAMILQHDHEDEFDGLFSDIELMTRARTLAEEDFGVSEENAIKIGCEVLKLYDYVEAS